LSPTLPQGFDYIMLILKRKSAKKKSPQGGFDLRIIEL